MTTRVTLETFVNSTLTSVQKSTSNMSKLQEQISTGKKINRPSDDAAGTRKILSLRSDGLRLDQYASNIQTATSALSYNESTLNTVADALQRITELTMQGVSDTAGQETRNINASEINQLLDTVLQGANSKRLGSYVFAGTETTTEPFEVTRNSKGEIDSVTYNGNREKIEYNIGPNTNAQVNQSGSEIFMDTDLFGAILRARDSLASGAISFARTELDNLESAAQNIRNSIAKTGGIASTLELSGNRIEQTKLSLRETLASTESADIAETILKLTEQQSIYEASLASSSYIFRTSILDYL